jgi:hypothetical protein
MSKDVKLGYAVPNGEAVTIPVRHMAITGQTQEAGKTTALEALIARSGLKAITFVTKRGEGAFTEARRVDPYFREQADWQFVASILEASRGEKLKFERAWIIRASKGARTLADVHRNVRKAMETAKGLAGDVYLTLDAYLEAVVPAIGRVRWASSVQLAAGVNAMDLTAIPTELQHLVIKSSLDWVLEHETDTVVVIPEAWKFVPQGRGTPVKLSAAAFIRQGAGLRNYLWLDSQDLGGIEKEILRSVPVWILGVQREANEIKRTLDNIPAGIAKPSKADIATLGLGHFFACWKSHAVKTYVQPTWMPDDHAQAVARGDRSSQMSALKHAAARPTVIQRKEWDGMYVDDDTGRLHRFHGAEEETVNETEARRLRNENTTLVSENAELRRRLDALERRAPQPAQPPASTAPGPAPSPARTFSLEESRDNDALYLAFKARLIEEVPALLKVIVTKPEIEMTVQRKTIQLDEYSLKGRIARLLREGFFREPRACNAVRTALKRTGPDANTANIGRVLDDFTRDGFVTDEGAGYLEVPGMKVNILEG